MGLLYGMACFHFWVVKEYKVPCNYDVNQDNEVSVQDVFAWVSNVMQGFDVVDEDTAVPATQICPVLGKSWEVDCTRYDFTNDTVVNIKVCTVNCIAAKAHDLLTCCHPKTIGFIWERRYAQRHSRGVLSGSPGMECRCADVRLKPRTVTILDVANNMYIINGAALGVKS